MLQDTEDKRLKLRHFQLLTLVGKDTNEEGTTNLKASLAPAIRILLAAPVTQEDDLEVLQDEALEIDDTY